MTAPDREQQEREAQAVMVLVCVIGTIVLGIIAALLHP